MICAPHPILFGDQIQKKWAGHVARMADRGGLYRIFVGKPEGKRPLGGPRRRWEDNIKMELCRCTSLQYNTRRSNVSTEDLQDFKFQQRCCWGFDSSGK